MLFISPSWGEAQEHRFTNPQVRVQITAEFLNVLTTGYPIINGNGAIPTDLLSKILISKSPGIGK
jgi:hypothetical protein